MSHGGTYGVCRASLTRAAYSALVGLHRPYSSLIFNPLESISSCAIELPERQMAQELIIIHTTRCLRAIEAQIRLMALPVCPFCHTPFTVCMVTTGTLPLLSACRFLFSGQRLAVARDQIRLSIGCLKTLGDIWAQGARSVGEIQTIAREVLGLAQNGSSGSPQGGETSPKPSPNSAPVARANRWKKRSSQPLRRPSCPTGIWATHSLTCLYGLLDTNVC